MKYIECSVPNCGIKMKDRINGSHLKRKHNLTLDEYVKLYPNSDLGEYRTSTFFCHICKNEISNKSEIKLKHLNVHGFKCVDDYNLKFEIKMCNCGCGEISDYSFIKHKYNDFKRGHRKSWNNGLTKKTDDRLKYSNAGGWNKGLNKNNNEIMLRVSNNIIDFWKNNPDKKIQMVNNIKKTMLRKYNVENANDFPSFWSKYKNYTMPSGKIVRIQGYENFGLDFLLKNYNEDGLIVDRKLLPKFKYKTGKTYTPDIHNTINNTIFEIKSTWTYKIFKDKDEKIKSVIDSGYNYTILIFNKKHEFEIQEYKLNN